MYATLAFDVLFSVLSPATPATRPLHILFHYSIKVGALIVPLPARDAKAH